MKTKSALFICLLAFAFLSVQCHSHEAETAAEAGTAVTEAISDKAMEVKEVGVATTKAVSDKAVAAKEALQTNAAETIKEGTPTLTAIKTDVEEKTSAVKKKVEATVKEAKKEAAVKKEATKAKKKKKKKKKKKARSAIKFEELSHGFGKIKQGEVIKHDFKFKNVGKAPLVIKKVDVSCGCTFPSYPFIPIEPGKEGVIGITYDSKNKAGRQKPTITVVTNGSPRTLKLHLEGYVE